MTSGQKVAFSLLISVLAFCAFTVVAFSGLFDLLEVNFYQPIVQEIKQKKIDEITAAENEYFTTLIKRFNNFTLNPSVKTYVDLHPDDSDTQKREILRAQLLTSTAALKGIRIIDKNGRNLYFSTFADDVLAGKKGTTYKNYENTNDFDFNSIMANPSLNLADDAEKKAKVIKNGDDNQLIFSLPFYNTNDSFAGTILFYCDASDFSQFLFNRNLIDINGFAALITPKKTNQKITGVGGFVFGLPNYGRESIKNQILKKWEENPEEHFWKLVPEKLVPEKQLTEDDSARENQFQGEVGQDENEQSVTPTLCAFSFKNERDDIGFITFLYDENELKFPNYMRILLLSTAFVTLYLAFFLILSFKHDDIVVIRDRIHRYESEFFIGCKKMGELGNPEYLSAQKDILEKRIFKSLGKKGRKHAAEFKSIFESTWQEMLFSFSGSHAPALMQGIASPINADELKQIVRSSLEDILGQGKLSIESVDARDIKEEIQVSESENEDTEDTGRTVEDFEEEINPEEKLAEYNNAALEEALLVEAAENESEADIPDFVEEAEAAEELEEPAEEAEPLEEAEDVEEAETAEEPEPLEEAEAVEEPEPLEEAEDAEELEELDGITSEADISEEIEPFTGPQQLQFETIAHRTSDSENDENHDDFVPASPRETFKELYEDLETLEEVSEREERAADLAKTLAALPEKPPIWTIDDNETLDSQGLSREFSSSELHDFQKLHDVAKTMDEIDTTLEELEPYDYQPSEESSDFDAAIKDVTKYPEDDFYKDEVLLEKIEFGVPTSELTQEATDDSVADNFIATAPDYTYLDEENLEEKALYQQEAVKNIEEDAHFYTNPNPLSDTEKNSEENEKNPKEFSYSAEDNRTTSINEISMDSVPDISKSSEKLNEPVPEDEIEEIEELEVLDEVVEELSEENADIVSEQDDSDIEEVEALEGSEENMPFMFTKIGSVDSSVSELMPDTSDVIVQENDGTFRLTEMPQVNTKLSLNIEFKKLVDSVLR